ncbi:MAG TPA: sn-glycerol-3-phosphate ABC transporter ATP-binding protein UgpC [Devosiaceae bacterium]|jgi:ABC-type sugar transport system ATPase subunit|nr:sn-glycerol-3-phosphate ABC transporter ATP-binding protein UgpC [Devosiaceae bacterium]
MARIELKSVRKSFQALEVIHGVDLTIEDGAFTIFVGPSGCGKSTLLRMMAGLEEVTAGQIDIDGARCDHLLPSARGMAMVFQSYALYPHMSVEENLRFGLENQKLPKPEIKKRVAQAADILQISHLLKRRPHQLSGGQSQRVAIGRAIVKEPKAFLFDEPLSNLDAELRVKMRGELVALHRRLGSTMVYVTHDQVEAMTMADKIVVLREGRIEQAGTPVELYARPANQFVAGFLGAPQMNFLSGTVRRDGNGLAVAVDEGRATLSLTPRGRELPAGTAATIGVRPEHLTLTSDGPLAATVEAAEILGSETIIHARLPSDAPITVSVRGISGVEPGATIRLAADDRFVHVFDAEGITLPPTRAWQEDYVRV